MAVEPTSDLPPPTRQKRTLFKLATVSLSVALCLILLEGIIRVVGAAPPLPEQYRDFIRDPYLPYVPKPDIVRRGWSRSKEYRFEYRHNSQGLRDEEHSIEKPHNVFRILALGDSFTWGVGADYEDTYLVRLEQLLNKRGAGHKRVEIIKAGVPRHFPEIERLQLEHYGIKYAPDLVLVAFVSNDIADTVRGLDALRPTSKEGYLISKRSERIGALGTWLYIHWHTARIALGAYLSGTEQPEKKPASLNDITSEQRKAAWAKVEEEYDRMYAIAHGSGAGFVVAHLPRAGLEEGPAKHLARIIERKPYEFIDVLPDMRASRMKAAKPLYWPKDRHCTPEGYAVIANTLYRELTHRKLVP
ncbi:MAG: SGNH/GDSL hydrolase family protein [Phycisphaerales bacterium]|nr:MAG: SGNH/GDSL hydrolase family protein [Phycisphaerales bacterium]